MWAPSTDVLAVAAVWLAILALLVFSAWGWEKIEILRKRRAEKLRETRQVDQRLRRLKLELLEFEHRPKAVPPRQGRPKANLADAGNAMLIYAQAVGKLNKKERVVEKMRIIRFNGGEKC